PCTSGRPPSGRTWARACASGSGRARSDERAGGRRPGMTSGAQEARTVLFVCHANTCRSVMAHALLEHMLRERGADGAVRVRSAGVGNIARDGMLASLDARLVLR